MSKTITRKYIKRITKHEGNTNIRQGGSGGGGGGGGGASQYWVEENYISKLFFNQLFTVYDEDGNVVEPNDTESVIASIKSMFGFWTDAYLSALGNGEGGGAELTLASLADVDVHGVANGQALVYDAYTKKWVPGQAGLDPTSLWQELGSLGTEQISSTHLTTALSTYNPTNNFKTINGNSIIGTGDINIGGGGGAYLPLSGGTMTGFIDFNSGYAKIKFTGTEQSANNEPTFFCTFVDNDSRKGITYSSASKIKLSQFTNDAGFITGSYLPLAGGTMTGTITTTKQDTFIAVHASQYSAIRFYDGNGNNQYAQIHGFCDSNFYSTGGSVNINGTNGVSIGNWDEPTILVKDGFVYFDGAKGTDAANTKGFRVGRVSSYPSALYMQLSNSVTGIQLINQAWDTALLQINSSGNLSVHGSVGIGTTSPSYKLHVAGTFYASGNSSIGGTFGVTGAATLSSTLSVTSNTTVGGTLGVTGAATLSSTLVVSGNAKFSGYTGFGYDADTNYRVKVKGVAYASTGFYSGGYVTALSDARHKDVKGDVGMTVSEVANAPAVKFLWKDRRQDGLQVGSIAQYWQKVMPEAIVKNADGELTMSYGVIALLASIATARKVEDHERRIRELEEENKKLKQQLNAA